jgi:hypothetical protein
MWLNLLVTVLFAFYVLRDAQKRKNFLFGVPALVWALLVLGTSIIGVVFYWLANCARFVRDQTLAADQG